MSFIQNGLDKIHFCSTIYDNLKTAKDVATLADSLFTFESTEVDQSVFQKIIPTKYRYWRGSDSKDLRGIVRKKLENARKSFDIAIGPDFNNSNQQPNVKNKRELLDKTAKSYCVYEIFSEFLSDGHFINSICDSIPSEEDRQNFKININKFQNIMIEVLNLRAESSKLVKKQNEISEKIKRIENGILSQQQKEKLSLVQNNYIQMCLISKENKDKIASYCNQMDIALSVIVKTAKDLKNRLNLNSLNKKINQFLAITSRLNLKNIKIDSDIIDFFSVRNAIKHDPEFQYKIVTFIYRMLYDPADCYNLALSMGFPGRALIACLSTRTRFFNTFHSRRHLPDSAFIIFKMFGLKKENLKIIENKEFNNSNGEMDPILNLTTTGSLLYQDMETFAQSHFMSNKYGKDADNNILINCFGHTKQELFAGDKNGYINSVWEEIESRFDKYSIASYLESNNILKYSGGPQKPARISFIKSIDIIEKSSSFNESLSKRNKIINKSSNSSFNELFVNRIKLFDSSLSKMSSFLTEKMSSHGKNEIDETQGGLNKSEKIQSKLQIILDMQKKLTTLVRFKESLRYHSPTMTML